MHCLISVIVPVYNSAPYLKHCLNSILAQTYHNLEIICIDDGSTDGSLDILREFEEKDSRIQVLSQKNAGVSAARNAGLNRARGSYITFVDSDDGLDADMYEVLLSLAQKHRADISHCGYKKVYLNGATKDIQGTGILLAQTGEEAVASLLNGQYFVGSPCNKLYKAELLSEVQFDSSIKINEDVLFNAQIFQKADRIVFWDVPKYHYFEHMDSSCGRTNRLRKQRDSVAVAEKIYEIYKDSTLADICSKRLYAALIGLYRICVMENMKGTIAERENIHKKVIRMESLLPNRSCRNVLHYRFMRYLPGVYRLLYRVYDRIRKPNWDL